MSEITDSILTSIKKLLGISEEYEQFDPDIIIYINSAFSTLNQLGVGPVGGFSISDKFTTWDAYVTDQRPLGLVKTYVFMKVKLVFDNSTLSSSVIEMYKQCIAEYEWRLHVAGETPAFGGGEIQNGV